MKVIAKKPAFITLKDHKDNFTARPGCRLINPTKSETGITTQKHLEQISQKPNRYTELNQWKNTVSVIECFYEIPEKP